MQQFSRFKSVSGLILLVASLLNRSEAVESFELTPESPTISQQTSVVNQPEMDISSQEQHRSDRDAELYDQANTCIWLLTSLCGL